MNADLLTSFAMSPDKFNWFSTLAMTDGHVCDRLSCEHGPRYDVPFIIQAELHFLLMQCASRADATVQRLLSVHPHLMQLLEPGPFDTYCEAGRRQQQHQALGCMKQQISGQGHDNAKGCFEQNSSKTMWMFRDQVDVP